MSAFRNSKRIIIIIIYNIIHNMHVKMEKIKILNRRRPIVIITRITYYYTVSAYIQTNNNIMTIISYLHYDVCLE